MGRWLKFARDQRGYAAVEFTLLLPVLLIIVFGIIEVGSAWYARQVLINASREGARMGVLYSMDGVTDEDVEIHVENLLVSAGFNKAVVVDSTGAGGDPGDPVSVQVSADYDLPVLSALIPGVGGDLGQVTLNAATVMRHE